MNSHPHILIVEDNLTAMIVEKAIMENIGCEVDCAESGSQALDTFKKNHYDLILMDIGLPDIDGIEVTREIRELELAQNIPATPIVAVTGNNDASQQYKCMTIGMNGVYSKPFTSKEAECILNDFFK